MKNLKTTTDIILALKEKIRNEKGMSQGILAANWLQVLVVTKRSDEKNQ